MITFRKLISFVVITIITVSSMSNNKVTLSSNLDINRNEINVGVLLYNFEDLYLLRLKEGLEDIQKEKANIINFTFFDGKNNLSVQNQTLDSLLNNGIDLLVVTLADQREFVVKEVIYKVKQKNIPLILIGVNPKVIQNVSKDYNKLAFVTPDLKEPGIIEGNILVNLWNTNKEVIDKDNNNVMNYILLHGKVNSSIAIDRTNYSISKIKDAGIKTNELELIYANWSKELAKNSIENLFLKYGNKIEAIISNNDSMAIGAVEALQKYGYNKGDKSKYIAVVGIDGLPEAIDLIDKEYMTGTVIGSIKAVSEGIYTIGMNLINNLSPVENTNYEIYNGEIIIPLSWEEYTK